jgi:hypothetical protein
MMVRELTGQNRSTHKNTTLAPHMESQQDEAQVAAASRLAGFRGRAFDGGDFGAYRSGQLSSDTHLDTDYLGHKRPAGESTGALGEGLKGIGDAGPVLLILLVGLFFFSTPLLEAYFIVNINSTIRNFEFHLPYYIPTVILIVILSKIRIVRWLCAVAFTGMAIAVANANIIPDFWACLWIVGIWAFRGFMAIRDRAKAAKRTGETLNVLRLERKLALWSLLATIALPAGWYGLESIPYKVEAKIFYPSCRTLEAAAYVTGLEKNDLSGTTPVAYRVLGICGPSDDHLLVADAGRKDISFLRGDLEFRRSLDLTALSGSLDGINVQRPCPLQSFRHGNGNCYPNPRPLIVPLEGSRK